MYAVKRFQLFARVAFVYVRSKLVLFTQGSNRLL